MIADDFFDEYDELTGIVATSRFQQFAPNLKRWFSLLRHDAPKEIAERFRVLSNRLSWDEEETNIIHDPGGMIGAAVINWPDAREDRLSLQVGLFEKISDGTIQAEDFAHHYFYLKGNYDVVVRNMAQQLFLPFAKELRRELKRSTDASDIPAADRIVRIDHNQPEYLETVGAIEQTAGALLGDNSIGPEDRDRIKFELDSGILLLKAQSARISAIETVLIQALKWLSQNFAGAALGIAAERALLAVLALIAGG